MLVKSMPENNDYRGHGRYDESLARQVSLYGLISLEGALRGAQI